MLMFLLLVSDDCMPGAGLGHLVRKSPHEDSMGHGAGHNSYCTRPMSLDVPVLDQALDQVAHGPIQPGLLCTHSPGLPSLMLGLSSTGHIENQHLIPMYLQNSSVWHFSLMLSEVLHPSGRGVNGRYHAGCLLQVLATSLPASWHWEVAKGFQ